MPKLSKRGLSIPSSPIRKLTKYIDIAIAKGVSIIRLNIGQPDVLSPPKALEALKSFPDKILSYSPSEGNLSLRQAVVDFYKKNKIGDLDTKDVFITTGGSEALWLIITVITDIGDEILTTEPFFPSYNAYTQTMGATLVAISSYLEENFKLPKAEEFEKKISPKTKAILLCNPGNPAGNLYTKEELIEIKKIVEKHDIFLIVDEVYREFVYDGHTHTSALSFEDIAEKVIIVDSMSKRFSMCGARIGMIISKNHLLLEKALNLAQSRLSPPSLGQYVSEVALKTTPISYFEDIIQLYTQRRDFLVKALENIPGVKVSIPMGSFYTMVNLPIENAEHYTQWLLEKFSYKSETVMISPASGFYINKELAKNQVRIAYVLDIPFLEKAVNIINESLKVYPQTTR